MNDDTPIRYDPRSLSATNGQPIPRRPEYAAPIAPETARSRGRDLTRAEWEAWLDESRVVFLERRASLATEVAHTVRDVLREYETEAQGTPVDRLRNLARVFAASPDRDVKLAGKFVEIAILALESTTPVTPEGGEL